MSVSPRPITAIDEKYRVIARIGHGGTADIHLAVARGPGGFNKLVVLKSLREEFRGVEKYSEMFLAEARLNAQLSHPHIVQTNEIFEFDGLPVIVMEYLEGQTLGAVVRMARRSGGTSAFEQSMHLRVLSDVLHALDYAHNKRGLDGNPLSLVHCDVTPQNVFLTYEGEVKLLDFGIARQTSAPEGVGVGRIRGKARYMPPEQVAGSGIDQRTDLYAVGAMAWEAAAGVRLWADATEEEILDAVMGGKIPAPSSVTEVDPELEQIVMRALEPDKEKRYPTALAMQMDLDRFLGISGIQFRSRDIGAAVSALFAERRAQTQAIVADQLAMLATCTDGGGAELRLVDLPRVSLPVESTLPPRRAKRRRTMPVMAALVLTILAALGLVFWIWGREPSKAAEPSGTRLVELRITAFPAEAAIALDGVAVGANPYSQIYESSPQGHEIRVTAPGYETAVRTVTLDDPADVVITLKALPSASQRASPAEDPEPVASGTNNGAVIRRNVAKRQGCDPPSYFDEKGIKHFKPHCL